MSENAYQLGENFSGRKSSMHDDSYGSCGKKTDSTDGSRPRTEIKL